MEKRHHRATALHLPHCPPTQVNVSRLNPARLAGTRFCYPGGMKG